MAAGSGRLASSLRSSSLGRCSLLHARSLSEAPVAQLIEAPGAQVCEGSVARLSEAPVERRAGRPNRIFLVDTLALVRRLEDEGVPSKHAEAVTAAIVEVLNDSLENVGRSFVSKSQINKSTMLRETNLSKFKSEVQGSQEHHFTLLQKEIEKLRGDIEKIRSELKYEMDKVAASQRLNLNIEKGRTRDELSKQSSETAGLTNKLDHEIQAIRATIEASKSDAVKYCVGAIVSLFTVGLAIMRLSK